MTQAPVNIGDLFKKFESIPFDNWVLQISKSVTSNALGISRSAKLADVTSAEMYAIMKLATLPEETLALLSEHIPPKTTWLLLASASDQEIISSLKALEELRPGQSPYEAVKAQLKSRAPEETWIDATKLPFEAIKLAAQLAEDYSALTARQRTALKNFSTKVKRGEEFTTPQAKFLADLLKTLVDQKVVKKNDRSNHPELQTILVNFVNGNSENN